MSPGAPGGQRALPTSQFHPVRPHQTLFPRPPVPHLMVRFLWKTPMLGEKSLRHRCFHCF